MLNIANMNFPRPPPTLGLTVLCLQGSWIRTKTDSALMDGVDPAHIAACQKLAREGQLSFLTWHNITVVGPSSSEGKITPIGIV